MGKIGAFLSHLKPKDPLLTLIVFFSATQLGLHFWPLSALVYGVRIDYLSPTLYFLDLLILVYLFINKKFHKLIIGDWLLVILLVNLLFTSNPLATLSWSLHFLLYFLFLRSVPMGVSLYDFKTLRLSTILPLVLLFQLALAATQVSLGHSVGGFMYYLGERSVAVGSPAVALATFMGHVVLRAYGTFGHPNVLAGWSVVCLLILIRLSKKIPWGALLLTTLILLLTESRAALISLFGFIIPLLILRPKFRLPYYSITLLLCFFLYLPLFAPSRSDLSLSQRYTLQGLSLSVVRAFPIFGAGAQSSISTYPAISPETRLLQPDHNSFTLFLSWFGIFGVLAIIYSLRSHLIPNFYLLIPIAPLLVLDHYLLTSPQGLFILTLYFSVALNYTHVKNHRQ